MSKERELLKRCLDFMLDKSANLNPLFKEVNDVLLAQPEQEPVAWITEWVQRYRHNDTPIIDRAVSFTKGGAPAVPNPKYIPLYLAPPKQEPLSDEKMRAIWKEGIRGEIPFVEIGRAIEKQHGIGGGE